MPENSLPQHVAIIMDGNGRWATSRGLPRLEGHSAGAQSVRNVVEESRRLGIRYLTLFSFSTENWRRAESEVNGLMLLFEHYLKHELHSLQTNGIRLRAVGDLSRLPENVRSELQNVCEATARNSELDLVLAISYGSREEIVHAARVLAQRVQSGELRPEEISEIDFCGSLWTAGLPDPDLLIRSSGEMRISNFLLWQLAYAEIVVTDVLWPDFSAEVFREALAEFSRRERRFGLSSDQLRVSDATNQFNEGERLTESRSSSSSLASLVPR